MRRDGHSGEAGATRCCRRSPGSPKQKSTPSAKKAQRSETVWVGTQASPSLLAGVQFHFINSQTVRCSAAVVKWWVSQTLLSLKESRIDSRLDARRCPLSRLCHSSERPLGEETFKKDDKDQLPSEEELFRRYLRLVFTSLSPPTKSAPIHTWCQSDRGASVLFSCHQRAPAGRGSSGRVF